MICDVLVAIVDRDQLDAVLPAVHQHALGHVARVLDAGRGELPSQLRRAGVPVEQAPDSVADAPLLVVISAAARCPFAAHLLMRSGIDRIWIVSGNGVWTEVDDSIVLVTPNVADRRDRRPHVPVPGIRDRTVERSPDAPFRSDTPPLAVERDESLPQ